MRQKFNKIHFDFSSLHWLTNPRKQLDLQGAAVGLIKLPPDKGYTFTHHHRLQEEVYIIISGGGFILVDNELIPLESGDVVRVSPESKRALKAGREGMFAICAGGIPLGYPKNPNARYLIDDGVPDYDDIPPWYEDVPEIMEKNRLLKKRRVQTRKKKA